MRYLKFISVILFFSACQAAPTDCKKYFSGKWIYQPKNVNNSYVVRTLEKQIEYIENGKYHYDFEIKWINSCKYEIKYVGTNHPNPAVAKIGEITTVEILNIDDEHMSYRTFFRDLEQVGQMVKTD